MCSVLLRLAVVVVLVDLGGFGRLFDGWVCVKDPALFQFFPIWNDMFIGGRGDVILRVTFLTGGGDLWGGRTWFFMCGGFVIV